MRILIIGVVLLVAACTPDQSTNIGNQPKKTVDSVSSKIGEMMPWIRKNRLVDTSKN